MSITFDTNILIYATDPTAGGKHTEAAAVMRRSAAVDAVLTLQALAEFFAVAVRRKGLTIEAASEAVDHWRAVFPVVVADESCLAAAMEATRRHGLSFRDAMMWAAARRAGCSVLFSEDFQDGRSLGGVTFVDPFAAHNRTLIDAVLPDRNVE